MSNKEPGIQKIDGKNGKHYRYQTQHRLLIITNAIIFVSAIHH